MSERYELTGSLRLKNSPDLDKTFAAFVKKHELPFVLPLVDEAAGERTLDIAWATELDPEQIDKLEKAIADYFGPRVLEPVLLEWTQEEKTGDLYVGPAENRESIESQKICDAVRSDIVLLTTEHRKKVFADLLSMPDVGPDETLDIAKLRSSREMQIFRLGVDVARKGVQFESIPDEYGFRATNAPSEQQLRLLVDAANGKSG